MPKKNTHEVRIKTMKNKGWDLDDIPTMIQNIINKYEKVGSRSNYFSSYSYYVRHVLKDEHSAKLLDKHASDLQHRNKDLRRTQKSKTKFISMDQLNNRRSEIQEDRLETYKQNILHLILAFNTLRPPLRQQSDPSDRKYVNMKLVEEKEDTVDRHGKIKRDNFIIVSRKPVLVINQDKVGSSHEPLVEELDEPLATFIRESVEHFPRLWLYASPNDPTEPLSISTYNSWLKDIHPGLSQNKFRHSYATNFFSRPRSISEKENLALRMRTSVRELEESYVKPDHWTWNAQHQHQQQRSIDLPLPPPPLPPPRRRQQRRLTNTNTLPQRPIDRPLPPPPLPPRRLTNRRTLPQRPGVNLPLPPLPENENENEEEEEVNLVLHPSGLDKRKQQNRFRQQRYRDKHSGDSWADKNKERKRCYEMIHKYNNKGYHPTEDTIRKYGLEKDQNGKWISTVFPRLR